MLDDEVNVPARANKIQERLGAETDWNKVLEEEIRSAMKAERDWIFLQLERRRTALRDTGPRGREAADAIAHAIVRIRARAMDRSREQAT